MTKTQSSEELSYQEIQNLPYTGSRDYRNALPFIPGVVQDAGQQIHINGAASNDVLEARVRSKLGRVVSHPKALEVKAVDGLIILSGPILAAEVHPLLDAIIHVRGVKNIENYLEEHEQAGDIPALQGGRARPGAHTTVRSVYADAR